MDGTSIHLDLDEHDPAAKGWAALWAACTVLTVAALLSVFAWDQRGPQAPLFYAAIASLTALAYLSTAYLLSNRLVVSRSPALVLLAATYLLCGIGVGLYAVAFSGFGPPSFVHGPEGARWFWLVWHAAGALGIIGFVALDDEWTNRQRADALEAAPRDVLARVSLGDAGAFMRGPLLLAVTLMAGSAVWLWRDQGGFARWLGGPVIPTPVVVALLLLDIAAVVLLAVALRRDSLVRTWLMMASVASLVDVAAMSWTGGSFTVGWYFSQACALVGASVLPIVLVGDLRTRLVQSDERSRLDPSLVDEPTGFANERGLAVQFDRIARVAAHGGVPVALAVAVVDEALPAAPVLRRLFRATDAIGRTGEREFAVVLTPGSDSDLRWLPRRVEGELRRGGAHRGLGLRIGVAVSDPSGPRPAGELFADTLARARLAVVTRLAIL